MKRLSKEAKYVLSLLSSKEKTVIQNDYPFKKEQAAVLKKLRENKVKYRVITEISGIKKSTIHRRVNPIRANESVAIYDALIHIKDILRTIDQEIDTLLRWAKR